MANNWQKDYPSIPEMFESGLNENSSFSKMAQFITEGQYVVDFGCATGYFSQLLQAKGCCVTGVEINENAAKVAEQFCDRVIVADLDFTSIEEILSAATYDVAVFGDVLEHLRDPWRVLNEVKAILKPDGYVVASIPNVAHGAVRLALLQGKFEYEKLGLLDNTHLRFFTRTTVEELFAKTGYFIDACERTIVSVFANTNVIPQVDRQTLSPEVVAQVEQEPDSDTLQFVVRAYPQSLAAQCASLGDRYERLMAQYKRLLARETEIQANLQASLHQTELHYQATLQHYQQQLEQSQIQLESRQIELEQMQLQARQSQLEGQQVQEALAASLQTVQAELQETRTTLKTVRSRFQEVQNKLKYVEALVQHAQNEVVAMKTSKFWQLRQTWFNLKGLVGLKDQPLPEPPSPPVLATNASMNSGKSQKTTPSAPAIPLPPTEREERHAYEIWIKEHTPTDTDLKYMAALVQQFAWQPLISIVVPVYNPPAGFLEAMLESVLAQIYPNWELCIADDASTRSYVRDILERYIAKDQRIKVAFRSENGHISRCSNSALELATGDYIALLDHDDLLAPEALYEVVALLNQHPEADMIYSDEDKLDELGQRCAPFFKPDWSPDSFLSRMYTCHLGVYRHRLIQEIGGFRVGYEGSQDYDLVLRLTERTQQIFHIPKVLYHWRIHPNSVANGNDAKPYAHEAAKQALLDALDRRGEPGRIVDNPNYPGTHYIRYDIRHDMQSCDRVSIIIPTRDLGHVLNQCLESIFQKSTYLNFEVILIDNGSIEPYTSTVINQWLNREPERFKCYCYGIPFNYSKLNNFGVSKASGKYLLFLNNDTEVLTPDWIEALVEQAQRPSIGAVGAMLLYPDDTIQHAGVILVGGVAGHSHKYFPKDSRGYGNALLGVTNYSAVTGACLMCRREVFEKVNGFEEEMAVAFNDVDFCLKIVSAGFHNVWLPHVVLYHHESKTRGIEDTPEKVQRFMQEVAYMRQHWHTLLDRDPCYSINLSPHHEDYRIRRPEDPLKLELCQKLEKTIAQVDRVKSQLAEAKQQLANAQDRIVAMETSKFWKLRRRWFQVKRLIGVKEE